MTKIEAQMEFHVMFATNPKFTWNSFTKTPNWKNNSAANIIQSLKYP